MPGLDAIDADVAPQQGIAIVLLDAVPLEFLDRVDLVVLGIVVDQRARQQRDIASRCVVLRIRQTAGIDVVRVVHAEPRGVLVHQVGEQRFRAGGVFGKRNRGIVAGLDDHAVQQFLQRHLH